MPKIIIRTNCELDFFCFSTLGTMLYNQKPFSYVFSKIVEIFENKKSPLSSPSRIWENFGLRDTRQRRIRY